MYISPFHTDEDKILLLTVIGLAILLGEVKSLETALGVVKTTHLKYLSLAFILANGTIMGLKRAVKSELGMKISEGVSGEHYQEVYDRGIPQILLFILPIVVILIVFVTEYFLYEWLLTVSSFQNFAYIGLIVFMLNLILTVDLIVSIFLGIINEKRGL